MSNGAPKLRPYQGDVIARFSAEVAAGRRKVLLAAPTGSGKTVIAAEIIRRMVARDWRVLFLAHRRELIKQASAKLHAVGIDHGIIQAGFNSRLGERVQVASISTLHARAFRTDAIETPIADLVLVDEAHHCRAKTYRQLLDAYPNAVVLGLTATPCRSDGKGLGNIFEIIIECPPVSELIDLGHLVRSKVFAPSQPDLKGVQVEKGDYIADQVAERIDRPDLVGDIVTNWLRLAERRRTVVFATGVAHSLHIRDQFRAADVWAEHLDGSTPVEERDAILANLAAGTVEVVSNAMVLTEGVDIPAVSCLVLARPTKHMGLYRQMVGRVLRPDPSKADALILDHAGAVFEHGFVEDHVEWTLSEDKRAENRVHRSNQGSDGERRLDTCPECKAVRFTGRPCPVCGWRTQPKPQAFSVRDGDLGEVDHAKRVRKTEWSATERYKFHQGLLWIARERGYRSGWAAHKYREKFGTWPVSRFATLAPADDTVRSWVRSRQIAYAKAIRKAAS